ncbi:MAG: response regulator [Actinobacteria bacterium]|nr:response regulator [Actinomycetota bacterium]
MGETMTEEKVETVLVIDDDPTILNVIRMILETNSYRVQEALSGEGGFTAAKEVRPDAILLDIMMPDLDGFELCRRLKLDEECRDIPVIFVTAKTAPEHLRKGLSLGASGFVTKPFTVRKLVGEVAAAIDAARKKEQSTP